MSSEATWILSGLSEDSKALEVGAVATVATQAAAAAGILFAVLGLGPDCVLLLGSVA